MAKSRTMPGPTGQISLFPPEQAEPEPAEPECIEPEEQETASAQAPTTAAGRPPLTPTSTTQRAGTPHLQLLPLLHEAAEDGRHRRSAAGLKVASTLATLRLLRRTNPLLTPRGLARLAAEEQPDSGLKVELVERLAGLDTGAVDPRLLEDQRCLLHQELLDGRDGKVATEGQVADFMAMAADPEPDSQVLDLTCGSGRLLIHAWLHMLGKTEDRGTEVTGRIQGMELNMDLVEAAASGLKLHNVTGGQIAQGNSIDPQKCRHAGIEDGRWDLVIANLPLGVKVARDAADRCAGGPNGILAAVKGRKARTEAEILLLQRVNELLAPGTGRAALIVSDGLLSNGRDQYARDWMLQHFALEGVVSLPRKSGSAATAKTSVILMRRLQPGETQPGESLIFMAICKNDGHDGRKETSAREDLAGDGQERAVLLQNDLVDYLTIETRLDDGSWLRTSRVPTIDPKHSTILAELKAFYRDAKGWGKERSTPGK